MYIPFMFRIKEDIDMDSLYDDFMNYLYEIRFRSYNEESIKWFMIK